MRALSRRLHAWPRRGGGFAGEDICPHPRFQRGQAIVLIAIMLAVVVGMAALAIDGSRAYALRRDLQAAVDAAALAAADRFQQTGRYDRAEQAAAGSFGTNLRLYASPSCPSGWLVPAASPVTVQCTYSDGTALGTVLTMVVSALGPQGSQFGLTATRSLPLQFARILTNGATPTLSAAATGGVNNLLYAPALAVLNQAGCGGAVGNALTVNGTGTLDVQGDIVSSGAISVTGGNLSVAGDIYARCQASVPGLVTVKCYPSDTPTPCTFPDVAGATRSGYHFVDPHYPPPPLAGLGRTWPFMGDVVRLPGVYGTDPVLNNNLCWFLSAGVYSFTRGFTNDGDFVSNELKPPAEPNYLDNTRMAPRQFWNTNLSQCAGDFALTAVGAPLPILTGTWAIVITSTRTDTYGGLNYARESAPSFCRTVSISPGQVMQVNISNVPGATGYNVYAAPPPNGCGGIFGFAGSINVTGAVTNNDTSRCPKPFGDPSCTLGFVQQNFDSNLLGGSFVLCGCSPGLVGAPPPDGETAPLGLRQVNQNPDRAATVPPYRGDRANENLCKSVAGSQVKCPDAITPGAVAIYIPSGGCITDTNNGDNFVFSGYQYNWIALYEPSTNTGCPPDGNLLDAASNSAFIGLLYTPAAAINIPTRVGFRAEATGGIIADKITFSGQLPLIVSSPAYSPVPPAARLVG